MENHISTNNRNESLAGNSLDFDTRNNDSKDSEINMDNLIAYQDHLDLEEDPKIQGRIMT